MSKWSAELQSSWESAKPGDSLTIKITLRGYLIEAVVMCGVIEIRTIRNKGEFVRYHTVLIVGGDRNAYDIGAIIRLCCEYERLGHSVQFEWSLHFIGDRTTPKYKISYAGIGLIQAMQRELFDCSHEPKHGGVDAARHVHLTITDEAGQCLDFDMKSHTQSESDGNNKSESAAGVEWCYCTDRDAHIHTRDYQTIYADAIIGPRRAAEARAFAQYAESSGNVQRDTTDELVGKIV